ncbi:MAG: hypothetical protein ACO2O1_08240 [Candidatus Caldarchaeales archaeon]|jgi:hypothetical protein
MAAIAALVQTRKKGWKAERSRKKASLPEMPKMPEMPKPLRDRVIREKPDDVQVIDVARPTRRGLTKDPIVVVTKGGRRKVVGAWIDI